MARNGALESREGMPEMVYRSLPARRILILRGLVLYVLLRCIVGVVIASQQAQFGATTLSMAPVTSAAFAALVGALVLLDTRRRHDDLLLANLGVGPVELALAAALPAICGEVLIAVGTRR